MSPFANGSTRTTAACLGGFRGQRKGDDHFLGACPQGLVTSWALLNSCHTCCWDSCAEYELRRTSVIPCALLRKNSLVRQRHSCQLGGCGRFVSHRSVNTGLKTSCLLNTDCDGNCSIRLNGQETSDRPCRQDVLFPMVEEHSGVPNGMQMMRGMSNITHMIAVQC